MPSSFTTPPLAVTGAVIAAADINVFRDNDNWFNQLIPQPISANMFLLSSSTAAAAWALSTSLTVAITTTAVITALGFQAGASGVHGGAGGVNGGAGGVVIGSGGISGGLTTVGIPAMLGLNVGASGIAVTGVGGIVVSGGGSVVGTTADFSGAVATGALTVDSIAGGSSLVGVLSMLGLGVGTTGMAIAGQIASSLSDGSTPPITIHASQANVACTNLRATSAVTATNALQLGSVLAAGYPTLAGGGDFSTAPTIQGDAIAKFASGSYSGNGASARQITTGFQCKYVKLTAYAASPNTFVVYDILSTTAAENPAMTADYDTGSVTAAGAPLSAATATVLHGSDGFVVDGLDFSNTSGLTYRYVAFG